MRRKNISSEMMMDYISQALLLLMRAFAAFPRKDSYDDFIPKSTQ